MGKEKKQKLKHNARPITRRTAAGAKNVFGRCPWANGMGRAFGDDVDISKIWSPAALLSKITYRNQKKYFGANPNHTTRPLLAFPNVLKEAAGAGALFLASGWSGRPRRAIARLSSFADLSAPYRSCFLLAAR